RRGHDQTVGFIGTNKLIVHVCVKIDHSSQGGFSQHGVVERFEAVHDAIAAAQLGFKQLTAADAVLAPEGSHQLRVEFVHRNCCQETESSQIYWKQRDLPPANRAGSG